MAESPDFPAPYADVNVLLAELLRHACAILDRHFIGMFLFGSLASGDFDQDSDIDVLIVTDATVTAAQFASLHAMHALLARRDTRWALELEVSYIPQHELRRYDPAHALHPHLDRGPGESLHWMQHGSDWIVQRHVLRERGIVLAGCAPSALIDPVSADDLREAMRDRLAEWAQPMLENRSIISGRGYQSYMVLSMCRVLYTLEYGTIVSKPAAARWAQAMLDARWSGLIDRAWIGRHHPDSAAAAEDIDETLALIGYVLERSQ